MNIFFAYGNKHEEVPQSRRTSSGDKLLFGAKCLQECCFPKVLGFCFLLKSENVCHSIRSPLKPSAHPPQAHSSGGCVSRFPFLRLPFIISWSCIIQHMQISRKLPQILCRVRQGVKTSIHSLIKPSIKELNSSFLGS